MQLKCNPVSACLTQLNLTAETLRFIGEIFKHGEAHTLFWVFSVSFRLYGALAENTNIVCGNLKGHRHWNQFRLSFPAFLTAARI